LVEKKARLKQTPLAFSYCGDHLSDANVIYLSGLGSNLVDMDVDCDGMQGGPADNGRCSIQSSPDTQNVTTFQNEVAGYQRGIVDLNTYIHPYVVFGNSGSKTGWSTFDPTAYGVQPLSLVAVVCGNSLVGLFIPSSSSYIMNQMSENRGMNHTKARDWT
jgi:hypothetical protein